MEEQITDVHETFQLENTDLIDVLKKCSYHLTYNVFIDAYNA